MTYPTTPEAIRDRAIEVVRLLIPASLAGDRFIAYRNEGAGDFEEWLATLPLASRMRRFQIRDTGDDDPPAVEDRADTERRVALRVLVAYPHTNRYGPGQPARDAVIEEDQRQLEDAIGLGGRGNFRPPHADACWREGSASRIEVDGATLLELVLTYSYVLDADG